RSLMSLQPQTATLIVRHAAAAHADTDHDGHDHDHEPGHDDEHHDHEHGGATHEHTKVVPATQLMAGDVILVKPGERIAADSTVKSGESSVNQAAVTGESIPVVRRPGDA